MTFPVRRWCVEEKAKVKRRNAGSHPKSWWQRWQPAWRVRWQGGSYKLNFDLHHAGGLWVWAMLLVLAWSSVAFNLSEVYNPVMRSVFAHQVDIRALPTLPTPQLNPLIDWLEARRIGRQLMAEQAQEKGFTVNHESSLYYDAERAVYRYRVHSSRDVSDHNGSTQLVLDANNGELKSLWLPSGAASGDTVTTWVECLHMAALWGWPFKVFMSLMGVVAAMLSVTGVIIWWRKRNAQRIRTNKQLDKPHEKTHC